MEKLPVKLSVEPLVDALFEIRFTSLSSVSSVLPGILYNSSDPKPVIEQLPNMSLPKEIRDSDPNLRASPLVRMNFERYFINIGDSVLTIGCKLPYSGWENFKPFILKILKTVNGIGVIENIDRYSMKYIDLIPGRSVTEQLEVVAVKISVGDISLDKQNFNLRLDVEDGVFKHYITLSSSVNVQLTTGETKDGMIVDVDTIVGVEGKAFGQWIEESDEILESIHLRNKRMFFQCLKQESIEKLGPVYG